jgi:hypothetical protein
MECMKMHGPENIKKHVVCSISRFWTRPSSRIENKIHLPARSLCFLKWKGGETLSEVGATNAADLIEVKAYVSCQHNQFFLPDFRLPTRCWWDLRFSGLSFSIFWHLFTDVTEQRIAYVFKGATGCHETLVNNCQHMLSNNGGDRRPHVFSPLDNKT